jgi:hypothetical protein
MASDQREHNQLFFRLCSDHLSIEAIPKRHVRMNFDRIKETPLPNYEVLMWTPQFVVLRNMKGHEITVRKDGRMVIRKAVSESAARTSATETWDVLLSGNR